MQEGAPVRCSAAPIDLDIAYYRREEEIDQSKGWRRRCLCTRILKVEGYKCQGSVQVGLIQCLAVCKSIVACKLKMIDIDCLF